jgi:hypothetical protein
VLFGQNLIPLSHGLIQIGNEAVTGDGAHCASPTM